MLQKPMAFDADPGRPQTMPCRPGSAAEIVSGLVARLRDLGLLPALLQSGSGITAAGADLQVWPRELAQSELATALFLRRVAALVSDRVPVTVSLRELGSEDGGIRVLESFCARLRGSLGADATLLSRIGLSLHSHQIPLQAYFLISRTLLGSGPRYIILDSLQMQHHDQVRVQEETDRNWSFLWRQRNARDSLIAAYGAGVRTGCPLLGDEAAEAVLPLHGIQVPAGTAWLPIALHLPHFADDDGHVSWDLLEKALEGGIDYGDQLLEIISWPTACQRSDAWLNRRLCLLLGGIGDLVRKRGMDPAKLECLRWVDKTVLRIRKTLWDRSHFVAGRSGLLPALLRSDPSAYVCDHSHRQDWRRRWRAALAKSAVRHRNLLVLSPYSVLPAEGNDQAAFTDLLPVLTHADAFAFAGQPFLDEWNAGHFRKFHTRAWAVMQRRNGRALIAAGA